MFPGNFAILPTFLCSLKAKKIILPKLIKFLIARHAHCIFSHTYELAKLFCANSVEVCKGAIIAENLPLFLQTMPRTHLEQTFKFVGYHSNSTNRIIRSGCIVDYLIRGRSKVFVNAACEGACAAGNIHLVQYLILHGAALSETNIHDAIANGHTQLAKFLIDFFRTTGLYYDPLQVMIKACAYDNLEIVRELYQNCGNCLYPAVVAYIEGSEKCIWFFQRKGLVTQDVLFYGACGVGDIESMRNFMYDGPVNLCGGLRVACLCQNDAALKFLRGFVAGPCERTKCDGYCMNF